MLTRVRQLAADALGMFWDGERIPIRESNTPVRVARGRHTCPKYEIVPRISEVLVSFELPGASSRDTELLWNPQFRTLSLRVHPPAEQNEDLSAVLAFTSDVDGARGHAILKEGTLRVRLPRRDVDTLTGLPE